MGKTITNTSNTSLRSKLDGDRVSTESGCESGCPRAKEERRS